MIVCSCNLITRGDIEAVIEEILLDDPYAVLTPGLIYHRLGRRGKCCGCFPHVSQILVEHGTTVRERMARGAWAEEVDEAAPLCDWTAGGLASRHPTAWNYSESFGRGREPS